LKFSFSKSPSEKRIFILFFFFHSEDYFKLFRTRLVLLWVFTNFALVIFFTNDEWTRSVFSHDAKSTTSPYLTFVFWAIACLSSFRFLFSTWYMLDWFRDKAITRNKVHGNNRFSSMNPTPHV